jgi:hypothetical protein
LRVQRVVPAAGCGPELVGGLRVSLADARILAGSVLQENAILSI